MSVTFAHNGAPLPNPDSFVSYSESARTLTLLRQELDDEIIFDITFLAQLSDAVTSTNSTLQVTFERRVFTPFKQKNRAPELLVKPKTEVKLLKKPMNGTSSSS